MRRRGFRAGSQHQTSLVSPPNHPSHRTGGCLTTNRLNGCGKRPPNLPARYLSPPAAAGRCPPGNTLATPGTETLCPALPHASPSPPRPAPARQCYRPPSATWAPRRGPGRGGHTSRGTTSPSAGETETDVAGEGRGKCSLLSFRQCGTEVPWSWWPAGRERTDMAAAAGRGGLGPTAAWKVVA